jgi:hypothetical protein
VPRRAILVVSQLLLTASGGAPSAGEHVSLAEALRSAQAGAVIELDDGRYDAEHGESWGYEVPDGVTLRGSGKTVLSGSGVALRAQGRLDLQQLTFAGFELAVSFEQAARLGLSDIVIEAGTKGVLLDAAGATLELSGGGVTTSDYAVELGDACTGCAVTVTDNFAGSALTVQSSTVRAASGPYGMTIRAGRAELDDVAIKGSSYCVYQIAGRTRLRRSRLTGYRSIGLYLASGELDLGTAAEAGDNAFAGAPENAGGFGIYVDTGTAPVTSSDTSFAGVTPPAGTVEAGAQDWAEPGQYFLTPGQSISFYRVR